VVTRRSVLLGSALGLVGWMSRSALADVSISKRPMRPIVHIFLRGGADGLNMVVPTQEARYFDERPTLAVKKTQPLGEGFGLHPALAPLYPFWDSGKLAIVHAVGSEDTSRSHFEAMAAMERGGAAGGWLARYLAATSPKDPSPLRAIAHADVLPEMLRGGPPALALRSVSDFRLAGDEGYRKMLDRMYAQGDDAVRVAGRQTLATLDTLHSLDPKRYVPRNGAKYPNHDLGTGLQQVAMLLRAGVGLEAACLDHGVWDTHVGQDGFHPRLMAELAGGLAAFATDLGPELDGVTVVAMSEFGRRVGENAGLGTDHGRAAPAFLLGGGVRGGRFHGRWPGLTDLDSVGDLRVTDSRTVLASALRLADPATVFPGVRAGMAGLYA
jgi:uncharacterized protein (DUF1501 family)